MTHRILSVLLLTVALAAPVLAQAPAAPQAPRATAAPPIPQPPTVALVLEQNARDTQQQLREVLRQLPPSVAEVLSLDPSLLSHPEYMAAYPTLAAFVAQHPDISRNPGFYFGERNFREQDPRRFAIEAIQEVMFALAALTAFVSFLVVIGWLVRQAVDYRRWNRLTRTQTEVHTKLLDRMQNNDDLLAYMQTPAGRRFLESAPIALDSGHAPTVAAPVNRMLWSVQLGVVLVVLGIGFSFARLQVIEELAQVFSVLSAIAVALGVGFVASAIVSYMLSARLGLLEPVRPPQQP